MKKLPGKSGSTFSLFGLAAVLLLTGCSTTADTAVAPDTTPAIQETQEVSSISTFDVTDDTTTYVVVNNNIPTLDLADAEDGSFEYYAPLDDLGRVTYAYANIGTDLMPTEKRESISSVKPTGWINHPYDFVDGEYLYNRCHLIGFQLTGENANWQNLMTGTRYFNVDGMLPFENMTADYAKETGNHVLYKVVPYFEGDDLVAKGLFMEALSVEDEGDGISFNVFVRNVQPGVTIDYATGENWKTPERDNGLETYESDEDTEVYVLNTSSKKIHLEDCPNAKNISEKNRLIVYQPIEELLASGYTRCGTCLK